VPYSKEGIWKPNNPKQVQFLSIPISIKEAFFGGGAGSGKSELLLMYAVVNGWHAIQGFKQVFMRRKFPEIRHEIVPRSKQLYTPLGAKFNKSDMAWTFPREDQYGSGFQPDGGIIFFGHCENEDDVHGWDGTEINLFTPDELTSFTEYQYLYIGFTRVRTGSRDLPAIIRSSGMPGNIGHTFVKKRFVDPAPLGGKILIGKGNNKRFFVHSTYLDNIDGDPNYGTSLEALPEAEKRAKKYGDWSSFEGSVFEELRTRKYPDEPENAIHVVEPFQIPSHWPKIVAMDWGFSAMCSIGWAAISPSKRVYVYRHQTFTRMKIEEWTAEVKHYVDTDHPIDIVICHSANQHRGEPHTILEQVSEALAQPVRIAEKDRIGGKLLLHEYLRWKQKDTAPPESVGTYSDELAQWIRRNKGEAQYLKYVQSFQLIRNDEVNIPKLQFFNEPDVQQVWEVLKACNYAKSDKTGKKKEDVAEFEGDDPYDMLRMLVYAADRHFDDAGLSQKKVDDKENALSLFKETGDLTAFYRNMRQLESNYNVDKPIKRFHRRIANRGSLSFDSRVGN